MKIGDLIIAADFGSIERQGGDRNELTRAEARTLAYLIDHPDRLLTRSQILDAIDEPGSDKSDRSVDILINRLRRKLADDAKAPALIATRYGEGYVWIGGRSVPPVETDGVYLVLGPVNGLGILGEFTSLAHGFCRDLHYQLQSLLQPHQKVVLNMDSAGPNPAVVDGPEIFVELTFFLTADKLHCVITARGNKLGRVVAVRRRKISAIDDSYGLTQAQVIEIGRWLLGEIWKAAAIEVDSDAPLPVALYTAALTKDVGFGTAKDDLESLLALSRASEKRSYAAWEENARRLELLRTDHPDDPRLKIAQATHIHTKYIMLGHRVFAEGIDDHDADETAIESLVVEALPYIHDSPDYAIMAAKLLFFVNRGYSDLAAELSETALASSFRVASSLSIVGQLRAYLGDTESALQCLEQAVALCENNSEQHLYTLVIKCQILMSIGDYARLSDTKRELYRLRPMAALFFEPLYSDPDKLSLRAKAAVMMMSRKQGAGMLAHIYYVSARLFKVKGHGANTLRTPFRLMRNRFGDAVVSERIRAEFPQLMRGG